MRRGIFLPAEMREKSPRQRLCMSDVRKVAVYWNSRNSFLAQLHDKYSLEALDRF
jgi:hypothetical protein